ncbi:SPOR domain-containing protein [Metapseudomonas otitidis]|uniref:SPOR domain-containing protein n=1 Tax=Metapseudomonas otitidis TaxID=319939 RepID=UPI0013F65F43|nr:SPOR domain-containing protein [Pseudomonas otitidis]
MRWLFLLLLVLNLFYYVWHQQQAPLQVKEVETLSLYRGGQQGIRLLGESKGEGSSRAQQQSLFTSGAQACLFLGGLGHEDQVKGVEQRLLSLNIQSSIQSVDAAAGVDYWVYLAPLASRQASLRQLKELQARKIDSFLISQGDLQNGISLGIFPRLDSAESVMSRLKDAGYEPLMRELPRAHRDYWVRVDESSRRLVDDSLLAALVKDFPGLQHKIMPCQGVASGE